MRAQGTNQDQAIRFTERLETRLLLSGTASYRWNGAADVVALQQDGTAIVAGIASGKPRLARFDADAKLDRSFGKRGYIAPAFRVREIEVQRDGRVLVIGEKRSGLAIARYLANGSIDRSFGRRGIFFLGRGEGHALAPQPNGRILAAGSDGEDLLLLRLTSRGKLDGSFASKGVYSTALDSAGDQRTAALGVGVLPDGRVVVGGAAADSADFSLVRLLADGTPDPSLEGDGVLEASMADPLDEGSTYAVRDLALLADGRMVLVGEGFDGAVNVLSVDGELLQSIYLFRELPSSDLAADGVDWRVVATQHDESVEDGQGNPGDDHNFFSFGEPIDFGGDEHQGREWSEFALGVALREGFAVEVGQTGNRWGIHHTTYTPTPFSPESQEGSGGSQAGRGSRRGWR